MQAKFSAQDIYDVMHPNTGRTLTDWQAEAVEKGSLTGATLVVAGAGSGKTELMAVRVLWLVANGYALPEQILGLTFTRKAASELSKRVYLNLLTLKSNIDMWPAELGDDFTQPTILTYNSYANSIFRDYAVGLGYEAEATLLTDAGAYQLASEVVIKDGEQIVDALDEVELSLNTIVDKVISLAAAMNDNLSEGNEVESFINRMQRSIAGLPKTAGGQVGEVFKYYTDLIESVAETPVLAKLAQHYRDEKQRLGYVDYSDQVVLAERAARMIPDVKVRESQRFKFILLDEYQDTSVLQTQLLSTLFADCAVYAVGDPNQSIYGWRGASAANITTFGSSFSSTGNYEKFELPTSWRNPRKVLSLANYLAADLAMPTSYASAADQVVKPIELRPADYAKDGTITADFLLDSVEESKAVASWFAAKLKTSPDASAALLLRTRTEMAQYVEELQNAGLDAQVVGLGGLLDLPEIVDLVAALKVIHSPDSGTELIRLLTGARWRVGAKDIQRLHNFARQINRLNRADEEFASEDSLSLVDALDRLREPREAAFSRIPEPGLSRLIDAAHLFANLRKHTGLPLVQFVRMVEQELWLDIEVMANPRRRHPMVNLNAFANIVAGYAGSNRKPYLGAFLTWLEFADQRERFEPPTPTPEAGVVQVLTVHAAKGLEWDYVAIASLTEGNFPSAGTGKPKDWLSSGVFPWPLRGDNASLPEFKFEGVSSQKELEANRKAFKDQVGEHLLREELRLMYVAVTRPRTELLLTGSYYNSSAKKPKEA
ncbi:MAG: ATP-dependent helicase, partial [Micrococcales bacterium]